MDKEQYFRYYTMLLEVYSDMNCLGSIEALFTCRRHRCQDPCRGQNSPHTPGTRLNLKLLVNFYCNCFNSFLQSLRIFCIKMDCN